MRYVKWTLVAIFWILSAGFLHYTVPQFDVARITDTYEKRIDFGENSIFWASPDVGNNQELSNRDVFFIQARLASDQVMVYRNEDTGWGWPPYFKFDTSNLQAEAADVKSTAADPIWVAIRHYGWRNEFLSIFPNAISVELVSGPDVRIIPWTAIVVVLFYLALVWGIWVRWRRFRARRIDPVLSDVGDSFEAAGDSLAERRGRFGRWLDTWKKKP